MFTSLTRLFQEWKRYGAVRRELSHLSDRELADIGITRSDIDRIATDHTDRRTRNAIIRSQRPPPQAGAAFFGRGCAS